MNNNSQKLMNIEIHLAKFRIIIKLLTECLTA